MTDEEMAEKYAKGLCKTCKVDVCRYSKIQTCVTKESLKQAYLAGLKAGRETEREYVKKHLTKAKEIIRKFSEFVNNKVEYDLEHPQEQTDLWNELCEKAEEFLNSEVEQ